MITEPDIDQAILECQAEARPNAWTCMRLAAFLTIKQQMFPDVEQLKRMEVSMPLRAASFDSGPPKAETVSYSSGTEFGRLIDGKRAADIWPIMDELMSITHDLHPQIYRAVIEKIK